MTKHFNAKTTILLCCLVALFVCTLLCAQFVAPAQADSNYSSTYITAPTFTVLDGKTLLGSYADTQIAPTGEHVWSTTEIIAEVPATCTSTGTKAHYVCTICGDNFDAENNKLDDLTIAALGHSFSTTEIIAEVPATCTSTGTKAHWHCDLCNKNYDTNQTTQINDLTINKLAHGYGEWTNALTHICTATGNYAYRQCADCKEYQYIEDLTVTDYNAYVSAESHPALKTCASTEFDTKIKLAQVGHSFGAWVAYKAQTCTENGNWWHRKCENCNLYEYFILLNSAIDPDDYLEKDQTSRRTTTDYSDVIGDLVAGHNFYQTTSAAAKDATCTEDGNYEWKQCKRCKGYEYKIGENTYFCAENEFNNVVKLPKHHTWGDVVKGYAATCVATGIPAYRQCTVTGCGACQYAYSKYDADANYFDTATTGVSVTNNVKGVPTYRQLNHDFVLVELSKTPTCTEYGNYNYWKCDRGCNQYQYTKPDSSDKYYCNATKEDYNTYIRRDMVPHSFATSCQKKCSNCTYEREDSERVHNYNTTGNAAHYNNNTKQHAYFCQNDNCLDGILYEDHSFETSCQKKCSKCPYEREDSQLTHSYTTLTFGTINGTQDGKQYHWYKCSNKGCTSEDTANKVACVIKYENKDADTHVSYCEVAGERHELGEGGKQLTSNHSWTNGCVFDMAKFNAGEGNFHAKKCTDCDVFKQNEEACNVVYYTDDDDYHWQICDTCKHKLSDNEAHNYVTHYDEDDHWLECSVCAKVQNDAYFDHSFESSTSTSCSEEGCGYQRFLKANVNLSGYAIDALVGGLTASATTDRTDVNLSLVKYYLFDGDDNEIDFANSKSEAKMTFRPNSVYYAFLFFDCGDVYPSNDMTAADFTLPKGYEYGYYDIGTGQREDGTCYVQMCLFVVLSPLGGVSAEKSISEIEIDFKNFEVGNIGNSVEIDITGKGVPADKSFGSNVLYFADAEDYGVNVSDYTIRNVYYEVIMQISAPYGFNFYGLTESGITIKNGMGTAYMLPVSESSQSKVSKDGKTIALTIVLNGLVPEHVCGEGEDGWEIVESSRDYLCPDITTQHTRKCKICGAIEFVNHVYDGDMDTSCNGNGCDYERNLKLDEMHFTLTGYQSDALLCDIDVTYSGKYASTDEIVGIEKLEAGIVDLDTMYSYSLTAIFVPGNVYGILIAINIPIEVDPSNCLLDNVYVNNTKVNVVMADANGTTYYYVLQLPAVTGESKQTKVSNVNLEVNGFINGFYWKDVTFRPETITGIASYKASVTKDGSTMAEMQAFEYGYQYLLTVKYVLSDGYYGTGVTADDLKVSHYAIDGDSQKIDLGNFECSSIIVDDFGDDVRTITCTYLVVLVVPSDVVEEHDDGHVFPTENPTYHADENKHYVLCGCGAHDEGEDHVYEDDFFICSVCGYERFYSAEKVEFEIDWHVGNSSWDLWVGTKTFVDDTEVLFSEYGTINIPLFIEDVTLYEGTITDLSGFQNLDEEDIVLANKSYTLLVTFVYLNNYMDCGSLIKNDYTIKGVGKTPITASYLANISMGGQGSMVALFFYIPATEVKHIHGGAWIDEVPATCTATGTKAHYVCTICDDNFDAENVKIDDLTIPALGHNSDGSIAHKDANCTETGVVGGSYCTRCNDGKTAAETVILALGHSFSTTEIIAEVPSTCTATGTKAHYVCTVCGDNFDAENVKIDDLTIAINPNAHKFGTWIDEVPATLEKEGAVAHKDCEYCHKHFDTDGNEIANENYVIAKIKGYNLIFKIDGNEVAKHYLEQGSAVTYPESGSKLGFTFAWSQTIATMPNSDVTIEGVYSIDVNYFKSKVDAVQNATTVEDIYSAIVSANTALALYDGMDTQSIADQITRLDTLTTRYTQMAQAAENDVKNAVNVVDAVFGALVQMAIVALATVIVKRRLF